MNERERERERETERMNKRERERDKLDSIIKIVVYFLFVFTRLQIRENVI